MVTKEIKSNGNKLAGRLVAEYRNAQAWSQAEIADRLGVSRVTVVRWESGEVEPSGLALRQFEKLISDNPVEGIEISHKKKEKSNPKTFTYEKIKRVIIPSPFVFNGPKDQNSFHNKLIDIQQHADGSKLDWEIYKHRLSLVESADDQPTAQYLLESPNSFAKSWSSNYGPHGWHRYVGRFPPHLIRALLNHFQATSEDVVCDPFAGSGTTIVEARLLGIPSLGIEVCPLSSMIIRTKSTFPSDTAALKMLVPELEEFYQTRKDEFLKKHLRFKHSDILSRKGNNVKSFANIERWFSAEALLGVSLVTEFAATKKGYEQEMILTALSARMRSIGNVDVDVVRAEYSKKPREKVDVLRFVRSHLLKMIADIQATLVSHRHTLTDRKSVKLEEKSLLETKVEKNSISYIITSPPYGVESLSYLRTHLLSYRSLAAFLKTDPYEFGTKVIGSEYLPKNAPEVLNLPVAKVSKTYRRFFEGIYDENKPKTHKIRVGMMMHFFQDMHDVVKRFNIWVKPGGKVAFVIGNKKIEDHVIPTDTIISEIFASNGFKLEEVLEHKLKTNNSNSRVPWQDKIIEREFVMIFGKT